MCIFCKEEVQNRNEEFWIGLDIPYLNLITHKQCFRQHKHNLNDILKQNSELIWEIFHGQKKNKDVIKRKL